MTTAAAAAATNNGDPAAGANPGSNLASQNPGAAANAPWYGDIPAERADLREWVTNKNYKDPISALESGYNLEKLIGFEKAGRTVVLPKDDKDIDGIKAYRAKTGVPDAPEKYELPMRVLKDGEQHSDTEKKFSASAAAWMHANNIPKAAAHAIVKNFDDYVAREVQAQKEAEATAANEALGQLKGAWGDKFEERAEYARRFVKETGADDAWLAKYEATFGTADLLQRFYKWGSATGEHPFTGGSGGGGGGLNVSTAKAQLDALRMARSDGTITDVQWEDGKQAEFERLSQFIADKSQP